MKAIKNGWRLILAAMLVLAAVAIQMFVYNQEKDQANAERVQLGQYINNLKYTIAQNEKYASVKGELPAKLEELNASRLELYKHFPKEMKEEDQIMYVLYLEQLFGTEISFSFGQAESIVRLSDGAVLTGLTLTVNYECSYDGFKEMVKYLSSDEKITSVRYATMQYDKNTDTVTGTVTITLYLMNTDKLTYEPPVIGQPDTGKDSIFE